MLKEILHPEVQRFIQEHENEDEKKLLLKAKSIFGVPASVVADQIRGRRKAKNKLPVLYKTSGIIYPPSLNLEQSSSEITAKLKTTLIEKIESEANKTIADLSGGFGIDTWFFSRHFNHVHYVEPDEALLEIVKHNHAQLGRTNIQHHHSTAEEFLQNASTHFDWLYVDPSRRDVHNRKVFRLQDCAPDIVSLHEQIFRVSDNLLIKASPMLDIQQGVRELKTVCDVFVVSVDNECRELLFFCTRSGDANPLITAIDITGETETTFSFTLEDELNTRADYAEPKKYLYEPNAALLKAGAFRKIAEAFKVSKIHPNTHLYTSDAFITDFPGKKFLIEKEIKPDPKTIREFFPEGKANVTTRNYPLTPDVLKKKTGLKDGGDKFLIGFSGQKKKYLVVASRF